MSMMNSEQTSPTETSPATAAATAAPTAAARGDVSLKRFLWMAAGLLLGLGVGLALLVLLGPGRSWFTRPVSPLAPAVPQINQPAPDFSLRNLAGEPLQLSDLRGRSLALNFWATWCGPCQLEMPLLQKYQQRYPQDLLILAINNDEAPAAVQAFVDELGLDLEVLLDPGAQVTDLYRVRGFPTTVFIDPQGVMRYQHIGLLNESLMEGYIRDLGVSQ